MFSLKVKNASLCVSRLEELAGVYNTDFMLGDISMIRTYWYRFHHIYSNNLQQKKRTTAFTTVVLSLFYQKLFRLLI